MTGPDDDRVARAALCRLAEPNDPLLWQRVQRFGAPEVLQQVRAGDPGLPGVEHYRARLSDADPQRDLDRAGRTGTRLVVPGDLEWPSQLEDLAGSVGARGLTAPPLALWVRGPGNLRFAVLRSVALVGSRAATAYGTHVAAELGAGLADAGWAVVSGGAYGIDAAAHRGVLAGAGSTVAVLACGVDVAYPRGHDALFGRIAAEGLLVSELPPGCHPTRARFLDRNRLIAALTRGTVLVEAALRSGARNTAGWARSLSREVMAVPGPVTSVMSAGCHHEVRELGAALVTHAGEIVERVGSLTDGLAQPPPAAGKPRPEDLLDPVALRVLEAVPVRRPSLPAKLASVSGLSLDLVLQRLRQLELLGLVEGAAGGYRLAETPGRSDDPDPPPRGGA